MTLTFLITDLHRGGSPLLLADLAPGLAARGWDVDVVSIAPLGEVATLLQGRGIPTTSLHARFNRDLAVIPRFVRHLKARQPDIVCSVLIHANLLATMAKPFVNRGAGGKKPVWVQSIHTLQEKPRWHWTLQAILLAHADGFVAPSGAIMEKIRTLGTEVPHGEVLRNGIDVARFYEARPIAPVPWPGGTCVIGSIGRFDPVKRLDLLMKAMTLLPEHFHLALVGYGAEEARLRKCAAELPAARRIHFPGATHEPERWYKVFDIYCNLSSSEGFGLTLAEAACAGLPIVTCDTPAIRETLGELAVGWLPAAPTVAQVARGLAGAAEVGSGRAHLDVLEGGFGVGGMVAGYDAYFRTRIRGSQ